MLVLMMACAVGESPPRGPSGAGEEGVPGAAGPEGVPDEVPAGVADRASDLLARSQLAYEAGEVEESLRLAREVLTEYEGTASTEPARWVAARAAFALERYAEARDLATAYARSQPRGSERAVEARELAELAEDALEAPAELAVVGVVLPRSGPRVLVRYADWLLEGIELAVAEAERLQNRRIELVVADDAGGARLGAAVRELERRGAVAIVGPMLPEQVAAAAGARGNPRLVLISPTSTETPSWPEAYSVNSSDPRGAQELGRYAAEAGLERAAVLYPRMEEFEQKARAFAVEYEARGGEVHAMVPYDSGTTTFGTHMRRIAEAMAPAAGGAVAGEPLEIAEGEPGARPFALFVPAPPRDVQQIAPQIDFYGLDSLGVRVLGDEAWASAQVRRLVPDRDLEGVIAASRFPPERSSAGADPAFVEAYEMRYRRSLENQLPALGYDAAHLVMQALPNRLSTPDALARRFHLLAGIPGATGLLSVRASRVVRTPYLVVIRDGALMPAPRALASPAGVRP